MVHVGIASSLGLHGVDQSEGAVWLRPGDRGLSGRGVQARGCIAWVEGRVSAGCGLIGCDKMAEGRVACSGCGWGKDG
jgi:hypothetical protein